MAKKKKGNPRAARPEAKGPRKAKRQTRREIARVLGDGPIRRASRTTPRSQALPGMERVRNAELDVVCEDIAEGRAKIAKLQEEDGQHTDLALDIMRHDLGKPGGIVAYEHAGVTLARVPGQEKLLVKRTKARSSTAQVDAEPADDGDVTAQDSEE